MSNYLAVKVTLFPTKSPKWLRGVSPDAKVTVQVHSSVAKSGDEAEVTLK